MLLAPCGLHRFGGSRCYTTLCFMPGLGIASLQRHRKCDVRLTLYIRAKRHSCTIRPAHVYRTIQFTQSSPELCHLLSPCYDGASSWQQLSPRSAERTGFIRIADHLDDFTNMMLMVMSVGLVGPSLAHEERLTKIGLLLQHRRLCPLHGLSLIHI